MTTLGTFIQESPYPGKELSMQENQLIVEDSGPVTLGRIQELDKVGQIQWVSEDMRRLAYSLGQPVQPTPQPAPQPAPAPQQEPPSSSSSSSVLMTVIAIVAVLAICGGAYMLFSGMQADDTQPETPATESAPEPEAPAPEAPSDETT
jgi:hypothetical protein